MPLTKEQDITTVFRVNVLHNGKERWKYCKSLGRAIILQRSAEKAGICSIIYQKINGKYTSYINQKQQ